MFDGYNIHNWLASFETIICECVDLECECVYNNGTLTDY